MQNEICTIALKQSNQGKKHVIQKNWKTLKPLQNPFYSWLILPFYESCECIGEHFKGRLQLILKLNFI